MARLKRRQFLYLGAASILSALGFHQLTRRQISQSLSANSPKVYRSENGQLEVNLEATLGDVNLGGKTVRGMMSYNGQIPAPRLEVKQGDRLIIHFTNNLDQATNLHFHGLHLSPEGNQDNIFLSIQPGEQFTYELDIAPDQKAGTFWYHPHRHGTVAEQLFRGLAGVIVVRGDLDEIPEIQAAQEEFLVLQDFAIDEQDQAIASRYLNIMAGREGNLVTVNGQLAPNFEIKKSLVRLRLVNASPSRFYRLQLGEQTMVQIAADGSALPTPVELEELLLTPGQRAEVLIRSADISQPINLINLPSQRGRIGMGMGGMGMGRRHLSVEDSFVIATFQPTMQNAASPTIPSQLISVASLPEPERIRQFTLNHGMTPNMGMAFLINGQPFQGDRAQTTVTLNTVEDWEIINVGVMDHPFHIHVNDFQIVSRNDVAVSEPTWHDTVLVRSGERVKIRIAFKDFSGETVYHCHILDHEDLGMMGRLDILPD